MEKEQLRKQTINYLKELALVSKEKKKREARLYERLFCSEMWKKASVIGTTLALTFEIDTSPIIKQAFKEQKSIAVPKVLSKETMQFYRFLPNTKVEKSVFGVSEPVAAEKIALQAIELLLVPGLVFRKDGYRIGFGGGYYDRVLAQYTGESCSLLLKEQINEEWQPSTFDRPVKHLLIE